MGIVIAAICFAVACAILIYSCCLVQRRRRAYANWHVSGMLLCYALRSSVSLSDCFADGGATTACCHRSCQPGVLNAFPESVYIMPQAMLLREAR